MTTTLYARRGTENTFAATTTRTMRSAYLEEFCGARGTGFLEDGLVTPDASVYGASSSAKSSRRAFERMKTAYEEIKREERRRRGEERRV